MFTIEPTNPTTDSEYAALLHIRNSAWPDEPNTLESWRFSDDNWEKGKLRQRFAVKEQGRLIGEGTYLEPVWANAPGKYQYFYSLLPEFEPDEGLHTEVCHWVLAQLEEHRPTHLGTGAREDRTHRVNWLRGHGFVPKMRFAESELDITHFDFSRFNGAQERVESAGVKILPLSELMEIDPNWQRKLYEMLWEVEQDVPRIDPPRKEPFEEYLKTFLHPNFWAEAWQMAVDPTAGDDAVGAYVGVSMLGKNPPMPERIYTWLTGVVRSHRRKGIALAMKLRNIEFAIAQGAKSIRTDNEENNPMLGINKALGFQEIPAGVAYEKEL